MNTPITSPGGAGGNQYPLLPSIQNRPAPNFLKPHRANSDCEPILDEPGTNRGSRRGKRNALSMSMDSQ